jgi:hypothetical protein
MVWRRVGGIFLVNKRLGKDVREKKFKNSKTGRNKSSR